MFGLMPTSYNGNYCDSAFYGEKNSIMLFTNLMEIRRAPHFTLSNYSNKEMKDGVKVGVLVDFSSG